MENSNHASSVLNMFPYPAFSVKDGKILEANFSAQNTQLTAGMPITDLIFEHLHFYEAFTRGCLSLTLYPNGTPCVAAVMRTADYDIFHLRNEISSDRLQGMEQAAQQLRDPLNEILLVANKLIAKTEKEKKQAALLVHNVQKMQRVTNNISAAMQSITGHLYDIQLHDATALLNELFEEAAQYVSQADRNLIYNGPTEDILCPIDEEIFTKAIYGLLSNAIKGSSEKDDIVVSVSVADGYLHICIENPDNGMGQSLESQFFRSTRDIQIEDCRHGLGLGIPIAQAAVSAHGGILQLDRTNNKVRVKLAISMKVKDGGILRSSIMRINYGNSFNRALLELADVLPTTAYRKE